MAVGMGRKGYVLSEGKIVEEIGEVYGIWTAQIINMKVKISCNDDMGVRGS